MLQVELHVKGGGIVTTLWVPPFTPMPEGILWGQRVFFHQSDTRYVEGMLWASPPGQEVEMRERIPTEQRP